MGDSKKSFQNWTNDISREADGPDQSEPESDVSAVKDSMPPKEIPGKDHPHNEEIIVYNITVSFDDLV